MQRFCRRAARGRGGGPGWTPLVTAPRLASALGVGEVLPEARPREPDALLQGPRGRRRRGEGGRARHRHAGVRVDRQPRQRRRCARRRAAACARSSSIRTPSSPRSCLRPRSTAARCTPSRGSYDDCSRLVVELAGEVDWAFVNVNLRAYYAEGSKTLAFEIAEQLGWELPDAVIAPIASGSLFTKIWQGFEQFRRLGLVDGRPPRLYGGQAQGCSPVAAAFADDRAVSPVRPDDGRALARNRRARRRRSRDRHRARVGRRDLRGPGGGRRPEHVAARGHVGCLRRDRRGRDGRCAARCSRGRRDRRERPRRRARHGHGAEDTAAAIEARAGTEIEADVDELLERSGSPHDIAADPVVALACEITALDVRLWRRSTRASRR